jgi:adenosine/AMP kinase
LGQSHFVKTFEDIHEALVQSVPGIKFGLGFCESSGAMLVRWTGTDEAMIELANATRWRFRLDIALFSFSDSSR